jgi:benzoyl-CoA reductase subunit C
MKELLPDWKATSLEERLELCRELVEDTEFPTVNRWKEQGGKVLGHFQVYFPEEIAHAAGLLPVKVRGAQLETRRAESHFGSYLCSILKSSLEAALSSKLPLDFFVSHPICDAARNLAAIWGRNVSYPCQVLYLPQNARSAAAPEYLREEYLRLAQDLGGVDAAALRESIAVYNRGRELLEELYRLKRESPWLVPVDEAYVLVALAGLIGRPEYNRFLESTLELIRERPARKTDKVRVVWEGGFCEQPPLDMLRAVARSCYVVDDDLLIGLRFILGPVPLEGDPWHNLARAYIEQSSYSPVQRDALRPKEAMLLKRLRGCGAEAAILAAAKMCEPGLDEQVAYSKALDEEGVAYFVSEFEERMTSFDQVQIQLETFVENLLFD